MEVLFDYLSESNNKGMKTILATFISKHPLWGNTGSIPTVEYINSYSRKDIAEEFILKRGLFANYTPIKNVDEDTAKRHLIEYIDFIIPRYYYIKEKELKNKNKSREQLRREYNGIADVDGLIFTVKINYGREEIFIAEKNKNLPLGMKEYNELNYAYKRFSDKELEDILIKDCFENRMVLNPENERNLKRIDILRLLHYFYKGKEFKHKEKYILPLNEYKAKYDRSLEYCFLDVDSIKLGDIVTLSNISTEMDICGYCYNPSTMIGQVYDYDNKDKIWKVNWADLGVNEWENEDNLRVLNPNMEPIRSISEYLFNDDILQNEYYEDVRKYLKIGRYKFYRSSEYRLQNEKITRYNKEIVMSKKEKKLTKYKIYSHLRKDGIREYYISEIDVEDSCLYYIGDSSCDDTKNIISSLREEIILENNLKKDEGIEPLEIQRRNELTKFLYNESYETFIRRKYPTIKQLDFMAKLLDELYNRNMKNTEFEKFFYKTKYESKFILKPKTNSSMPLGCMEISQFIDNLKWAAYGKSDYYRMKFLKKYFIIK